MGANKKCVFLGADRSAKIIAILSNVYLGVVSAEEIGAIGARVDRMNYGDGHTPIPFAVIRGCIERLRASPERTIVGTILNCFFCCCCFCCGTPDIEPPGIEVWTLILKMLAQRKNAAPCGEQEEADAEFVRAACVEEMERATDVDCQYPSLVTNCFAFERESRAKMLMECALFGERRFVWLRDGAATLKFRALRESGLLHLNLHDEYAVAIFENSARLGGSRAALEVVNQMKRKPGGLSITRSPPQPGGPMSEMRYQDVIPYVFKFARAMDADSPYEEWVCLYELCGNVELVNNGDLANYAESDVRAGDIDAAERGMAEECARLFRAHQRLESAEARLRLAAAVGVLAMVCLVFKRKQAEIPFMAAEVRNFICKERDAARGSSVHIAQLMFRSHQAQS